MPVQEADPFEAIPLAAYATQCRADVDRALEREISRRDRFPPSMHAPLIHAVMGGAKRVRPLLAIATAEALGQSRSLVMPLACAIEFIHASSLVHDDLPCMDNAPLRRGRPTLHVAFGEALAVLAGDALLAAAFDVVTAAPFEMGASRALALVNLLSRAVAGSRGLVSGQLLDLREGEKDHETAELMHESKTGALFRAATCGAAIVAGVAAESLAAFAAIGDTIGLSFQVTDDIQDAMLTTQELGKLQGIDARNGRSTFLTLDGAAGARERARELGAQAQAQIAALGLQASRLAEIAAWAAERSS